MNPGDVIDSPRARRKNSSNSHKNDVKNKEIEQEQFGIKEGRAKKSVKKNLKKEELIENIVDAISKKSVGEIKKVWEKIEKDVSPDFRNLVILPSKMWEDREKGINPRQFIEKYYSQYLIDGLPRAAIRNADKKLYLAYAKWIERHPEDDLGLITEEKSKYVRRFSEDYPGNKRFTEMNREEQRTYFAIKKRERARAARPSEV